MKKTRDIIFICFFLLLIITPALIRIFHIPVDETNSEKKAPLPVPSFTLANARAAKGPWNIFQGFNEDLLTYKTRFDEYYTDNFKLKNNLFDLYVKVKMDMLRNNPLPDNVMQGKDGWFFLGNSYCNVMLEYTALTNFNQDEVLRMKENILGMADWLKAKNIGFYVVIAPDKQNIYGDYLPLARKNRPTKLDQMKVADSDNSYNLVDLSLPLNQNRHNRLFHKTDTHWNDYGAFIGFQALMKELKKTYPDLPALQLSDFTIDTVVTYQKDLTEMLRLKIKEDQIVLNYILPQYAVQQKNLLVNPLSYSSSRNNYEIRYTNNRRKLKVLVFRDSFSDAWVKYFKECFGESLFIGDYIMDKALIEKEAPDIVIYEKVERDIDALVPPAS